MTRSDSPSRAAAPKDDRDRADFRFRTTTRVMMSHTDQEGIANNISYYTYLELGRFEYFRALGLRLSDIKSTGTGMVMVESSCRFLSPLFFDDVIEISAGIDRLGDSSFHMKYLIFATDRNVVAARGHTISVFVDVSTRKKTSIPALFRELVVAFEGDGNVEMK